MSTTPRTDAAWNEGPIECNIHYIPIEFARTLETELAAMTFRAEKAESELVAEREKVRVLLEALEKAVAFPIKIGNWYELATAALAETKEASQ